jgi:predicted RNA-binding Zn ribbon-like protein
MRKRDWDALGERVEPGGRSPAPPPLRVVQQFVNTWSHELPASWDRLRTVQAASAWLADHRLTSGRSAMSESDRQTLILLREGLRDILPTRARRGPEHEAMSTLNALTVPLEVIFDATGRTHLRPTKDGACGVTARLLAAVHEASIDGSWPRLKTCRQCGWAFYDSSKNRSGSWCSMRICGNRSKNRSYRRRQTTAAAQRQGIGN